MNGSAIGAPRRGACPGLSRPLQTGDGLLARLVPTGTLSPAAFAGLCAAAREHGNGVVEVTGRGSIQVRGLSAVSAPRFAAAVAALDIAAADGVPVLTNALAGLDPEELLDAGALAADLRAALAHGSLATRLAPKVAIAIDGGGTLGLDRLAADVRLCAERIDGAVALRVSVGGDGANAILLGFVAPAAGVEAARRLLDVIARRGRQARARDLLAGADAPAAAFRSAVADLIMAPARATDGSATVLAAGNGGRDPIGVFPLREGTLACGIGLAFGHADVAALARLAEAAGAAGARGFRAAPERTLLALSLAPRATAPFIDAAERLGFIVHPGDPRRHVFACAGAPVCAAAHIPARALAPLVAAAAATAAPGLGDSIRIHISGCAKGCAHPAPAALTVVGTPQGCALIAAGSTRDVAHALVPADELAEAIAGRARELARGHGQGSGHA